MGNDVGGVVVDVTGGAGPDVADMGIVGWPRQPQIGDTVVVVVVVLVAIAAESAVLLPIARKLTDNNRYQCAEETYYMLCKHGYCTSA